MSYEHYIIVFEFHIGKYTVEYVAGIYTHNRINIYLEKHFAGRDYLFEHNPYTIIMPAILSSSNETLIRCAPSSFEESSPYQSILYIGSIVR